MNQHTIGQQLSGAREAIRASLYQASQDTKIRVDFLQAMENDDFEFVSGGPYVRGMLRSYVRWLGLDERPILAEFDRLTNTHPQPSLTEMISRPTQVVTRPRRPQWLLAAVSAAALLLILSVIGLINPSSDPAPPPADPVGDQVRASPSPAFAVEEPSPVPVFEGVNVAVTVTGERVWMNVENDNQEQLFVGTLTQGEERTWQAEELITMRIGDLGALNVTVNGRDLGAPGAAGQVATIALTPESTSFFDSSDEAAAQDSEEPAGTPGTGAAEQSAPGGSAGEQSPAGAEFTPTAGG